MDVKYRTALREVAQAAQAGSWSIAPCDGDAELYSVGIRTESGRGQPNRRVSGRAARVPHRRLRPVDGAGAA